MSQNVEAVKRAYEAYGRGDVESLLQVLDPQIEWVEPDIEGFPTGGTHRGVEAVVNEVFAVKPQHWEMFELVPDEIIDGGDTVVVTGDATARGKAGDEASWRFAHAWKLRDGKAIRFELFDDTASVLRSLGRLVVA
jgi:uncharacterized protein